MKNVYNGHIYLKDIFIQYCQVLFLLWPHVKCWPGIRKWVSVFDVLCQGMSVVTTPVSDNVKEEQILSLPNPLRITLQQCALCGLKIILHITCFFCNLQYHVSLIRRANKLGHWCFKYSNVVIKLI